MREAAELAGDRWVLLLTAALADGPRRFGDLAADVAAKYSINTVSGRLQLDQDEIRGVRGAYTGRYGVLEKHWLDFKANTVTGNVSVLHATVSA